MTKCATFSFSSGRSPHGERGLKLYSCNWVIMARASLPAWGAWIEIRAALTTSAANPGRSPHGERGLKLGAADMDARDTSRSPHGERGLKSPGCVIVVTQAGSLPAWGAWIEIWWRPADSFFRDVAPRMGSVD